MEDSAPLDIKKSKNCNEYIISEGIFTRNFEAMYNNVHDPWSQNDKSKRANDLDIYFVFGNLLQKIVNSRYEGLNVLDIGCADGNLILDLFSQGLLIDNDTYTGLDISKTAIKKANINLEKNLQIRKKNISYQAGDVLEIDGMKDRIGACDIIFAFKVIYYLGPEIDEALENIQNLLSINGLLFITYNFYERCFSSKWIDPFKLNDKLLDAGFTCHLFEGKHHHDSKEKEVTYYMCYQK